MYDDDDDDQPVVVVVHRVASVREAIGAVKAVLGGDLAGAMRAIKELPAWAFFARRSPTDPLDGPPAVRRTPPS